VTGDEAAIEHCEECGRRIRPADLVWIATFVRDRIWRGPTVDVPMHRACARRAAEALRARAS
jgi:hypothetical protein